MRLELLVLEDADDLERLGPNVNRNPDRVVEDLELLDQPLADDAHLLVGRRVDLVERPAAAHVEVEDR